jgi:putative transposase
MRDSDASKHPHRQWAEFRFSVVGGLLASPAKSGRLRSELKKLSEKIWTHPITGMPYRFGMSTIERWYYQAKGQKQSPIVVLMRKVRSDQGKIKGLIPQLKEKLALQYQEHRSWSYKLHSDNLRALCQLEPDKYNRSASYSTVRRYMQSRGYFKIKKPRRAQPDSALLAQDRLDQKEVRSYEVEHVGGLWHLDFHHGSRQIITRDGKWVTPLLLGILDDHSRLACHIQWYLGETTQDLVHGFNQALQRRGLPRALLTDNGSAMTSAEFTQGLLRLGIQHETTLPYSPYQNGKQECFWGQVEGRLMALVEKIEDLTLEKLNQYTFAWVEMEYNKTEHTEIKEEPIRRFMNGKSVSRPSPEGRKLEKAFRKEVKRRQRRSDGTLSLESRRFEIPQAFRCLKVICLHYASWDLSDIDIVDERTGKILSPLYPLNKAKNADGIRRSYQKPIFSKPSLPSKEEPPLLRKLLEDFAKTGRLPAYLPQNPHKKEN